MGPKCYKKRRIAPQKYKLRLIDLPDDVLKQIFELIPRETMNNVSMANKSFRNRLFKFVFEKIKIKWQKLVAFVQYIHTDAKILKFVECIRIFEPDIKLEWTSISELDAIFKGCNNMNRLTIELSSASHCLKYINFNCYELKELCVRTIKRNSLFNLEHLNVFKRIRALTLDNFQLFSSIDSSLLSSKFPKIYDLSLINCSWRYPFELSLFVCDDGFPGLIQNLTLKYHDNAFLLAERFQNFLENPAISKFQKSVTLDLRGNGKFEKLANLEVHLNRNALNKMVFKKL